MFSPYQTTILRHFLRKVDGTSSIFKSYSRSGGCPWWPMGSTPRTVKGRMGADQLSGDGLSDFAWLGPPINAVDCPTKADDISAFGVMTYKVRPDLFLWYRLVRSPRIGSCAKVHHGNLSDVGRVETTTTSPPPSLERRLTNCLKFLGLCGTKTHANRGSGYTS